MPSRGVYQGGSAVYAGAIVIVGVLLWPLILLGETPTTHPVSDPNLAPMWSKHIEPLLSKNCYKCHGVNKKKGGLDLRTTDSILAGGTDGSAVVPGRPGDSPIYQRIQPSAKDHMPPEDDQLSPDDISLVRQWILMLPTSSGPVASGAGSIFNQVAPSLMEQATRTKWQAPAGLAPSDVIDYVIENHWHEKQIHGSGVCDDRTFVRRIFLDLAGRIPTRGEADSFINSPEQQKRTKLVDLLLSGSEYSRHMAEVLDVALMERKGPATEAERRSHGWFDYLEKSIASNRPWNEMVSDLITARPKSPDQKGCVWFLYEKRNNHQLMAEAVAPIAFGVSIGCAQCHNDPLAHEIKQQNYWGLVAAFNRSSNADTHNGPGVSESAVGGFVNFTNLHKESQPAMILLLNDQSIDEKRPADGAKEDDAPGKYVVVPSKDKKHPIIAAIPKFSRRQATADAVTHDNPLLARAFVNRIWAMLLGRGLVNPVDQMDSRHPPSHPELLAWLAGDFEKSGYDVKRLIRTIVLSRTYQLNSRVNGPLPPDELFARGLEKPLSAEALYHSILVAAGDGSAAPSDLASASALRERLIATFPALFAVEYNATLQQAMFLTNNALLDKVLDPSGKNLTARLNEFTSSKEKAQHAFLEILGRAPDRDEVAASVKYLDDRSERPQAAIKQFAWTLIASPEFLMNH